jgi:hypothetical protein
MKKLYSRKFIILSWIILLATSCQHQHTPSLKPSQSPPVRHQSAQNHELKFIVSTEYLFPSPDLPARVFIFPPLRVNNSGNPREALIPIQDSNGNIIKWNSPTPHAEEVRQSIESVFAERGFRIIPFSVLMNQKEDYKVLVVAPYLSDAHLLNAEKSDRKVTFFVSLSGFLFPSDLNPEKRKTAFAQHVQVLCQRSDSFRAVIDAAYRSAVINIGKTRVFKDFVILD